MDKNSTFPYNINTELKLISTLHCDIVKDWPALIKAFSTTYESFLVDYFCHTCNIELTHCQGMEQKFWENEHAAKLLHKGDVEECLEKQL